MTRERVVLLSLLGALLGLAVYVLGEVIHSTAVAWSGLGLNIISTTAGLVAVTVGVTDLLAAGRRGSQPASRRPLEDEH